MRTISRAWRAAPLPAVHHDLRPNARAARRRWLAVHAALACTIAFGLGALALTETSAAATVTLGCAGKGPRAIDSSKEVHCAAVPGRARTLRGVVRNDAGKPVAGRLAVTFSAWKPIQEGWFKVTPYARREIVAKADGTFTLTSNPATRETIKVETVADEALGVGGAATEAEVSRQLVGKLRKLGGGRLRITVSGTRQRPLKVWVLDESGQRLPGVPARNVDRAGRATFDLGTRRGKLTYYIDAGRLSDVYWYIERVPFRL